MSTRVDTGATGAAGVAFKTTPFPLFCTIGSGPGRGA